MQVGLVVGVRGAQALPALPPEKIDRYTVSTAIVVRRAVKRLMEISYEMNDKSKRFRTLRRIRAFFLEDGHLLANRPRDAARPSAKALGLPRVLRAAREIDEVPARRRRPTRSNLVRPDRRASKGVEVYIAASAAALATRHLFLATDDIERA